MSQRAPIPVKNLEDLLHRMTDRIRQSLELPEILGATVDEMRRFLKTDRVKVYKFHEDGSGEVVAESIKHQRLPSLLGQRFPADDIPVGARELFLTARQRSIVNVAKQEIGISPLLSENIKKKLLGRVNFRTVDPCHVDYLTAMGVQASLVVPILHHYRLWGLLIAHHSVPKQFGNRELEIVQLIADQVSVAIAHANLLTLTRQQGQHESIINQIASHLHSTVNNPLNRALGKMVTALQCSGGRLYIPAIHHPTEESATERRDTKGKATEGLITDDFLANNLSIDSLSIDSLSMDSFSIDSLSIDKSLTKPVGAQRPNSHSHNQRSQAQLIAVGEQPAIPKQSLNHRNLANQKSYQKPIILEHFFDWRTWLKEESSNQIVANLWTISDIKQSQIPPAMVKILARSEIRSILVAKLIHRNRFLGYISLFRKSTDIETVWAGRLETDDPRQQRPRQSFEAWRELKKEQANPWTSWDIGLAQDLADRFASVVYQTQLYQKIQSLNADLEQRVIQRTSQLQIANKDLKREIREKEKTLKSLQEARDSLKRISHQNELILNAAGEGIYGIDPKGKMVFVNPAAAKILGYQKQAVVGHFMHDFIGHTKPDGEPYSWEESPIAQTIRHGKTHHATGDLFVRQDGSKFSVEYVSTCIQEKGRIIGAVVIFQDITERQAIESMRDEFIAVVSHELRTPLTSIRAALGLLAKKGLDIPTSQRQRMVEIASSNTNRLVRLVSDILDVERIKLGKITLNKRICDLSDIMLQSADEMHAIAKKQHIQLSIAPFSASLYVDFDRIIQTLTNLLSNAIKFSPAGATVDVIARKISINNASQIKKALNTQGKSAIDAGLKISECLLLIQVVDQGKGIPSNKLEVIFGQFEQLNTTDKNHQGGTGLGLAICRNIIRQHQGEIWAQSKVDEGSTFFFTLPIIKTELL